MSTENNSTGIHAAVPPQDRPTQSSSGGRAGATFWCRCGANIVSDPMHSCLELDAVLDEYNLFETEIKYGIKSAGITDEAKHCSQPGCSSTAPCTRHDGENLTLSDLGHWVEHGYVQCSACSGLHPAEAIRLLRTDGTKFASAPWKDGWPHLFQFEVAQTITCRRCYPFYTIHMNDASPAEFEELASLIQKIFGVSVARVAGSVAYFAPQTVLKKGIIWGEIVNGEPDFSAMESVNGRKKL